MKINISNNQNYSKTTVSHKAYMHKMQMYTHSPLKNVPGNFCACCKQEMIPFPAINNLWAKITLPISKIFPNKNFDKMKELHPDLYKVINYFAELYPEESFDSIMLDKANHDILLDSVTTIVLEEHDNEFPTSVAYRKAIKRKTMDIFNLFESNLKNSAEVIKELNPFKKYMNNTRKEVFEEFEELSSKYPDKTLRELVLIPEMVEKHITGAYKEAEEFAKERDYHWQKADSFILQEKPELKESIKKLHLQVSSVYSDDDDTKRISYLIKKLYKDFLETNNLEHLQKDVLNEVNQMPVREITKNLFLSTARNGFSDGAIVRYIIRPSMESEKRLIPPSEGGSNLMENKLLMCRRCCDELHTLPFKEFYLYHPEVVQNINDQIQFFENNIYNEVIDFSYRHYPIEVAKTLSKYSDGIIELDLADYITKITEMKNKVY